MFLGIHTTTRTTAPDELVLNQFNTEASLQQFDTITPFPVDNRPSFHQKQKEKESGTPIGPSLYFTQYNTTTETDE